MEKKSKAKARKQFRFEFSGVKFPSQLRDQFRACIASSADGVVIWVESKKTKQQWQATISNLSECGPAGVPEEAVVTFLKKAFELLIDESGCANEQNKRHRDTDEPAVDFQISEGQQVFLVLTLSMGGVWKPTFQFDLLPVGLDRADVLEAKLRDTQEELETLKARAVEALHDKKVTFLSLSSQTACANQQYVQWNGPVLPPAEYDQECFKLSTDNRQVTVVKPGVYQINIRLCQINSANGQFLCLQVNGADTAQCYQSNANSYYDIAHISEIVHLTANAVLQVRCGANSGSWAEPKGNRFTILRLGA